MNRAWLTYLSGATVAFAVLETLGKLESNRGNPSTLTAFTRRGLGVDPRHWRRWVLGPMFGVGLVGLGVHMLAPSGREATVGGSR